MKNHCKVIVFAKAPVAGFAKTRLARVIGNQVAANLAARMLTETIAQTVAAGLGPVELCCAPDTTHVQFSAEQKKYNLVLSQQGEGDLGQRMCRAFERALQQHQRVLLIGTDAPDLQAPQLIAAAHALQEHGAVFVPAHDGGYVLVGLSHPMPALFDGVAWSTSQVMSQTRSKLAELGESYVELPALHDVDEAQDLVHVPDSWMSA
jgi:rSAM/selenodomain-associated transferase 1